MKNNTKKYINEMQIKFKALSINESFARASIAGFCLQLNPSLDELTDIKTAVSEAVTNCIVHAYPQNKTGEVEALVRLYENGVDIEISDNGIGIENLEQAKQPFYTSKPNAERSGMGFTVMESFMDEVSVENKESGGLRVILSKTISVQENKSKESKIV